ncbi:glycosyltransferase family 4 protein [Microbacterium jejuense]|uniref:Glycosyltransferase family 4 protein n=1 Tax=Microbacterium jejuense TaxID=1263637 RepID=A0ABS7HIN2_9MICO|nr:glycosyltransferase family 4 protein [Microbacterium jejuense]MBW9092354.1 glycosyltransferase family 4 protein [Microbacterium jejuense]
MTAPSTAQRPGGRARTGQRAVTFLVPDGVDDPARVSGGNVYDLQVRDRLDAHGWSATTVAVKDAGGVASLVRQLPDDTVLLVDGLVAAWVPEELAAAAGRLRLVVLAHMVVAAFADATPAEVDAERRALAAAHRVVVPSAWTASEFVRRGLVDAGRLSVAAPGVAASLLDPVVAHSADADGHLLCVGVVAPHKGHDVLLAALAALSDLEWTCAIVGSTEVAPGFASTVRRAAAALGRRVRLTGVLGREALAEEYERAGLLVAPSRVESAGMAIGEARARGIPVVAADTGGIPETVAGGGAILVPVEDAAALAEALRAWLTDAALRRRLRGEARAARAALPSWDDTAAAVAGALESA